MDQQSLWLKNRSLFDTLTDTEYKCKEEEILSSCFGGTRNMVNIILQNQHNLSYIEQKHLHQILKKSTPTPDTAQTMDALDGTEPSIYKDSKKAYAYIKPRSLSHLNEDCLSYIFQFLSPKERRSLSVTSRNTCVASKSRKSYLNYDISAIKQKPLLTLYHFIHSISEIISVNHAHFVQEMETFMSWIKNQHNQIQYEMSDIICKSGLLTAFSSIITNTYFISHHIKCIDNILLLFQMLSPFANLSPYLINVNLIENMQQLIHILLTQQPTNDLSMQNEIISSIVGIMYYLYFGKSNIQTSVWNRTIRSGIIYDFISALKRPYSLTPNKDLFWLGHAMTLISDSLNYCDPYDDSTAMDILYIIQQYLHKIDSLVDVKSDKKWIYELLRKGNCVSIHDPNNDMMNNDSDTIFTISEIVDLSDALITLIGSFPCDWTHPLRKICIDISYVHCTAQSSNDFDPQNVYSCIMWTFQAILRLLSAYEFLLEVSYACIDFEDTKYKAISDTIIRISQVTQTQFPRYSQRDIFLMLLKIDWSFCMQLRDEIITAFEPHIVGGCQLYPLITVAWNSYHLEDLCQMQWFRDQICTVLLPYYTYGDRMPKEWDQQLLMCLLVSFYENHESYHFLIVLLQWVKFKNGYQSPQSGMDPNQFVSQNGIGYLLIIIANAVQHIPDTNELQINIIRECKRHLVSLYTYLPSTTYLRDKILKLDTVGDSLRMLKVCWWLVLKDVLLNILYDECRIKFVLQEMDCHLTTCARDTDTSHTDSARSVLLDLQSQNFEDDDIPRLLHSLLSNV